MFYLEQSIAEWRKQMLAAGIKTPVPLEELEIHVREEIEQQMKSGLNETTAFHLAVQKIGKANMIQSEFQKVSTPADVRKWKIRQIALMLAASVFPLWVGGMMLFKIGNFSHLNPPERMSGLAALAVYSLLGWSGRLNCRFFPAIRSKQSRDFLAGVFLVPVMLWWIVFFRIIVPRYDFTSGQLVAAFLWGFVTPMGLSMGLIWGMEAAAQKKVVAANFSGNRS
jgi:hypothetical protein